MQVIISNDEKVYQVSSHLTHTSHGYKWAMFNYFPFEFSFSHFLSMVKFLGSSFRFLFSSSKSIFEISNLIFEISSMIFHAACMGKTNKLMKVAPCVIMVKAKDLVQKGNNTMPKEFDAILQTPTLTKVCIVVIGVL